MPRISGHLDIVQVNEPSAPSAGRQHLYFKSDGLLYSKTSDGTVTQIGSGGGGGISAAIFDAKGDIIVASAADTAIRLALGSDNQVLTVDSAEAGGLKWTTPAAALVSSVNTRTGDVVGLAENSEVVHLSGTENITGAKTFLSSSGSPRIILKSPTLASAGTPTVNSPTVRFETGRWTGSAHSDSYVYLQAHQLSSTNLDTVLSVGTTSSLSNFKAKTVQAKLDYASKEGRYLGALPTGAPGSDPTGSGLVAFQAGDFVVNDNGSIYVHNGTMFVRVDAGAIHDLANAKGDLLVANAADALGRLAVGSNDTVLIADSTQNYGVRWGTVSDASAVKLTGAQTVAGVKTFSSAPVVPDSSFTIAKTTGLQTALDAKAADSTVVKLTGAQSLAGTKTFVDAPVVPDSSFTIAKTTGLQTALDAAVQKSLVDAKGDLLLGTADNTIARLAVGANGTVLTADSAEAPGVKWATVSGMTTNSTQTITSAAAKTFEAGALLMTSAVGTGEPYSDANPPETLMTKESAAAPSTPASGYGVVYSLTGDSQLYWKNDAGEVHELSHSIEAYTFSVTGTLTPQTGKSRIYLEGSYVVETVRAAVNTAPTGAAIVVDVNKNGTTLYTTQSSRPTISISGFTITANSPDVVTFTSGDYLTVDIDQVGSTVAGSDLTVTIRLRKVG